MGRVKLKQSGDGLLAIHLTLCTVNQQLGEGLVSDLGHVEVDVRAADGGIGRQRQKLEAPIDNLLQGVLDGYLGYVDCRGEQVRRLVFVLVG